MWHEVLTRLGRSCDIWSVDGARRSRIAFRRPDAWLFDGHNGPLDVREPQVIQLHEAPWNDPDTMGTLEDHFVDRVVEPSRRAAAVAGAIVCPSESSRRQIVEDCAVSPDMVFAAHHGVDHATFHPGLEGGTAVAVASGADGSRPYILTVASLHPRKNLVALREAVLRLAADGYPHQLVVVGAPAWGRTDAEAQGAAVVADSAAFPGRVVAVPFGISDADLAALMGGAAVFCLPSLSEGFGLPAAEAMACGTPTVVSNRAALREVGGDAAVLVEPDADSISAGIRALLDDPVLAKDVGYACATRAQEFSWDTCAGIWLSAIEFALTGSRRHD